MTTYLQLHESHQLSEHSVHNCKISWWEDELRLCVYMSVWEAEEVINVTTSSALQEFHLYFTDMCKWWHRNIHIWSGVN
jgi:hypothetical protein